MQGIVNVLLSTRELVVIAGLCKKPEPTCLNSFISPIVSIIGDIHTLSMKNAQSASAPFYAALAEGVQAFSWITV
jgi:hypothetical protein